MTQKIKIRDSHEEINIRDECYPFLENGVLYLRLIVIDDKGKPIQFLTITPYDILWRQSDYNEDIMNEIETASDKAHLEQAVRIATRENIDDATIDGFDDRYYG